MRLRCPNENCRRRLQAPDDSVGRKVRCPGCGQRLVIPSPDELTPIPPRGAADGDSQGPGAGTSPTATVISDPVDDPGEPPIPLDTDPDLGWIDETADRFEDAWKSGTIPEIRDYLVEVSDERKPKLLQELVAIDLEWRWKYGDARKVEEYLGEFAGTIEGHEEVRSDLLSLGERLLNGLSTAATLAQGATIGQGPVEEPRDPMVGIELGGVSLLKKLGEGGMGAVYLAHDDALDLDVAVKVLPRHLAARDQDYVDRFKREARAAARLDHPNVVKVLRFGEEGEQYYMVMEYVEGESLRDKLKREKRLEIGVALDICKQVFQALVAGHEVGILHRDIKPDNIFLKAGKSPGDPVVAKLGDFGIAKLRTGADADQSQTGNTMTGMVLGTPHYMSPEQAKDAKHVDARADIYSVGCMLYRMLCGDVPYQGASILDIVYKHINEPIPEPQSERDDLPDDLSITIRKMMAKDPDERFGSASEALDTLEKLRRGEEVDYSTDPFVTRMAREESTMRAPGFGGLGEEPLTASGRIKRWLRPVAAALLIALIAFGGYTTWRNWRTSKCRQALSQGNSCLSAQDWAAAVGSYDRARELALTLPDAEKAKELRELAQHLQQAALALEEAGRYQQDGKWEEATGAYDRAHEALKDVDRGQARATTSAWLTDWEQTEFSFAQKLCEAEDQPADRAARWDRFLRHWPDGKLAGEAGKCRSEALQASYDGRYQQLVESFRSLVAGGQFEQARALFPITEKLLREASESKVVVRIAEDDELDHLREQLAENTDAKKQEEAFALAKGAAEKETDPRKRLEIWRDFRKKLPRVKVDEVEARTEQARQEIIESIEAQYAKEVVGLDASLKSGEYDQARNRLSEAERILGKAREDGFAPEITQERLPEVLRKRVEAAMKKREAEEFVAAGKGATEAAKPEEVIAIWDAFLGAFPGGEHAKDAHFACYNRLVDLFREQLAAADFGRAEPIIGKLRERDQKASEAGSPLALFIKGSEPDVLQRELETLRSKLLSEDQAFKKAEADARAALDKGDCRGAAKVWQAFRDGHPGSRETEALSALKGAYEDCCTKSREAFESSLAQKQFAEAEKALKELASLLAQAKESKVSLSTSQDQSDEFRNRLSAARKAQEELAFKAAKAEAEKQAKAGDHAAATAAWKPFLEAYADSGHAEEARRVGTAVYEKWYSTQVKAFEDALAAFELKQASDLVDAAEKMIEDARKDGFPFDPPAESTAARLRARLIHQKDKAKAEDDNLRKALADGGKKIEGHHYDQALTTYDSFLEEYPKTRHREQVTQAREEAFTKGAQHKVALAKADLEAESTEDASQKIDDLENWLKRAEEARLSVSLAEGDQPDALRKQAEVLRKQREALRKQREAAEQTAASTLAEAKKLAEAGKSEDAIKALHGLLQVVTEGKHAEEAKRGIQAAYEAGYEGLAAKFSAALAGENLDDASRGLDALKGWLKKAEEEKYAFTPSKEHQPVTLEALLSKRKAAAQADSDAYSASRSAAAKAGKDGDHAKAIAAWQLYLKEHPGGKHANEASAATRAAYQAKSKALSASFEASLEKNEFDEAARYVSEIQNWLSEAKKAGFPVPADGSPAPDKLRTRVSARRDAYQTKAFDDAEQKATQLTGAADYEAVIAVWDDFLKRFAESPRAGPARLARSRALKVQAFVEKLGLFEIPKEGKDGYGNPIRRGADGPTGLPLELRHKDTGMHFVFIPAGTFQMGSPENEAGRKPDESQRRVEISGPFYLGKYEVTVGEVKLFDAQDGYLKEQHKVRQTEADKISEWGGEKRVISSWQKPDFPVGGLELADRHPAVCFPWNDAQKFVSWLNGRHKSSLFSLPTEAQWEYACRAGSTSAHPWEGGEAAADQHARFGKKPPLPVGSKAPNAWGLHDMPGNASEWVSDKIEGDYRICRGGSWLDGKPDRLRSAAREKSKPNRAEDSRRGFRVAVTAP